MFRQMSEIRRNRPLIGPFVSVAAGRVPLRTREERTMSISIVSQSDIELHGVAAAAVRVGTALERWGRRVAEANASPVLDRDEVELRQWAENERQLAIAARDIAANRQLYQLI